MSVWREISNGLTDKSCFPYFRKFNLKINMSINVNEETYDLFNLYASNIHDRNVDIKVDWELFGGGRGFSEFFFFLLIMNHDPQHHTIIYCIPSGQILFKIT